MARTVLQTAGSRGFRLLSLEARALLASLGTEGDAATHRAVGQELARDFTTGLSPEMARSFARRSACLPVGADCARAGESAGSAPMLWAAALGLVVHSNRA